MRIALFSTLLICWILFPDYSSLCTTLYRMNSQFTQYLSWNAVSLTRCIVRVYITTLPHRPRFLKNPYKRPARKKKKKTFSPPIHCTALEPACFVSFHVLQKKGHLSIHPAFFANGPSSSGAFSHRLLHKNGKRQTTPNSSSNLLPLMPHAQGSLVQAQDSSRTMVRMEELPNFKDAVSL